MEIIRFLFIGQTTLNIFIPLQREFIFLIHMNRGVELAMSAVQHRQILQQQNKTKIIIIPLKCEHAIRGNVFQSLA